LINPVVITALKSEFACLINHDNAILGGIGHERAAAAAGRAIAGGAKGVVSFGIAGGLDANLKAGDLVLAEAVVAPDGRLYQTDSDWLAELPGQLSRTNIVRGALAGSDIGVSSPEAKRRLAEQTGAVAVDMESHAIAAAAAEAGVAFLAVRAVADPHSRALPKWLSKHIDKDGATRQGAIAVEAMFRFWELPGMIGLAADSRRAHRSLRHFASVAGPGFWFGV